MSTLTKVQPKFCQVRGDFLGLDISNLVQLKIPNQTTQSVKMKVFFGHLDYFTGDSLVTD